jgi:hypothetical protein
MNFNNYIELNKVKKIQKDFILAKGLMYKSINEFEIIEPIQITNKNSSFYFKNCYDCLREALQAFLAAYGYKSYSHEATIQFAKENKILDEVFSNKMQKFRMLRNDIAYRAKNSNLDETKEIIFLTKQILPQLKEKLEKIIKEI